MWFNVFNIKDLLVELVHELESANAIPQIFLFEHFRDLSRSGHLRVDDRVAEVESEDLLDLVRVLIVARLPERLKERVHQFGQVLSILKRDFALGAELIPIPLSSLLALFLLSLSWSLVGGTRVVALGRIFRVFMGTFEGAFSIRVRLTHFFFNFMMILNYFWS